MPHSTRTGFRAALSLAFVLVIAGGFRFDQTSPAAQTAQPAPPPAAPAEGTGPSAQNPQGTVPIFRGGVNFVSVDVYPRRDGLLIEGLNAADFEVLEDGRPQKVETFEFVRVEPNQADSERRDPTSQADGDQAAANPRNRVFVVYLDTTHTSLSAGHATRQPVVDFLTRTIGPTDVFAFMTADIPVSQMVFGRRVESIEQQLERYWTWGQADRLTLLPNTPYEHRLVTCGADDELLMIARDDQLHTSLENLMARLRDLRDERKNVLFISEGWAPRGARPELANRGVGSLPSVGVGPGGRIGIGATMQTNDRPDTSWCDAELGRLASIDFETRFRALLESAVRSNVSFYPLDMGGLKTSMSVRGATNTLRTLAENTDGFAMVDTNDFGGGVRRIEKDLSAFYLLGYYSSNANPDGRFRRIEVKVSQPGASVSARRGYLAPTAEMMAAAGKPAAGPSPVDEALGDLARVRPGAEVFASGAATSSGLAVVAELAESLMTRPRWSAGADVRVEATRADGTIVRGAARIESGSRSAVVSMPVSDPRPGTWQIVVRVQGAEEAGVEQRLEVSVPAAALVGMPVAWRGTPSPRIPLRPMADAQLRRTERLRVEWPLLDPASTRTARLLDRRGQALGGDLPFATLPAERGAIGIDLPIAALPEGDYLVELVARRGDQRERRLMAFRVVR